MDETCRDVMTPNEAFKRSAPRRKRAFHRAIKSNRDIPGLSCFRQRLMINEMTSRFWGQMLVDSIAPNKIHGLLDLVDKKFEMNAPEEFKPLKIDIGIDRKL